MDGLFTISVWLITVAGYVTHLWWTVSTLLSDTVLTVKVGVIMLGGIIFAPAGIVHGIYLWF